MSGELASDSLRILDAVVDAYGDGERRPGQRRMCEVVAQALDGEREVAIQAPTGVGKSVAYLIPAALHAEPVVVSTSTKQLQTQLLSNDMPAIEPHLPPHEFEDGRVVLLKGRSNYLCQLRLATFRHQTVELAFDKSRASRGRAGSRLAHEDALLRWAGTTKTGDVSELPFEPEPELWRSLSVTPEECLGKQNCAHGHSCFAEIARDRALRASVIVVNHHVYVSNWRSGEHALPEHSAVVFDEVQALGDAVEQLVGTRFSEHRLTRLISPAQERILGFEGTAKDLAACGRALRKALANWNGERIGDVDGTKSRERQLADALDQAYGTLLDLKVRLQIELEKLGLEPLPGVYRPVVAQTRAPEPPPVVSMSEDMFREEYRARQQDLHRYRAERQGRRSATEPERGSEHLLVYQAVSWTLNDVRWLRDPNAEDRDKVVLFVEEGPGGPELRVAPLDVGPFVQAVLAKQTSVVLTSATVGRGLPRQLGFGGGCRYEEVESSFDYGRNSLLYVPRRLPTPNDRRYMPPALAEIEALISAIGGRTLVLCTSIRVRDHFAKELQLRSGKLGVTVLRQADGLTPEEVIRRLETDEATVVVATRGLWQGIDLPGETVQLVVIDRLPFPYYGHPLHQARQEAVRRRGGDSFHEVSIPPAARLLAQGVGRLIRRAEDRGVVAVLDSRLANARYNHLLLELVPPMRRTTSREAAVTFLQNLRHGSWHDEPF